MSTHASPGTAIAVLIAAFVFGLGGGAVVGTLSDPTNAEAASPSAGPTSASPTETTPASSISLMAEQNSVSPNEKIDITGRLAPAVGGVELIIQRSLDGGEWDAFPEPDDPVTVTTDADGSFSTWVVTGRTGENRFRVVGEVGEEALESEPVTVTIAES
jgi:hypothetical protein